MSQLFIQLSDSKEVKILYTGKFDHALYGKFEITEKDLNKAVANFNAGIGTRIDEEGKYELPCNFQHASYDSNAENAKAAGWIKKLACKGKELFASIEWTEKALEYIKNKEFKFVSAEFVNKYKDENGNSHGFTVLGLALTNVNFLRKGQTAIAFTDDSMLIFNETKEVNQMDETKLKTILNLQEGDSVEDAVKKLTEDIAEFEKQIQDLNSEIDGLKNQSDKGVQIELKEFNQLKDTVKELTTKNTELTNKLDLSDAEKAIELYIHNPATGKGKILPKQKGQWVNLWLNDPKGTKEILDGMPEVINFNVEGDDTNKTLSDSDPTVELNIKVKELMDKNKDLNIADAQNQVLSSDSDLAKRYNDFRN